MVELTIRCTNALGLDDPSPVDIVWELLTEAPYLKDEDSDDEASVGGYKRNGLAMRRAYDLIMPGFSIKEAAGVFVQDQSDYELRARLLRSERLFIVAVTYNGGQHPRLGEADFYWETDGDVTTELAEPIEVRRTGNSVSHTRSGSGESFRWTVSLEDCWPVVGSSGG